MPKPKSLNPSVATKVYLTEENAATLGVLTFDPIARRARFGEVSRIINLALSEFFSPSHKEYLEWKAKTQPSDSPSSDLKPSEAKS